MVGCILMINNMGFLVKKKKIACSLAIQELPRVTEPCIVPQAAPMGLYL